MLVQIDAKGFSVKTRLTKISYQCTNRFGKICRVLIVILAFLIQKCLMLQVGRAKELATLIFFTAIQVYRNLRICAGR